MDNNMKSFPRKYRIVRILALSLFLSGFIDFRAKCKKYKGTCSRIDAGKILERIGVESRSI